MQLSHQGFRLQKCPLALKLWTAIHVFQMLPEADILSLFRQESFSKLSRSNRRPLKKKQSRAVPCARSMDISMVRNDTVPELIKLRPLLQGANCCDFPVHVHRPTPKSCLANTSNFKCLSEPHKPQSRVLSLVFTRDFRLLRQRMFAINLLN